MTTPHSRGAIDAAEAITGHKYGSTTLHETALGKKTVEGIADIIERNTAAADLLVVVQAFVEDETARAAGSPNEPRFHTPGWLLRMAMARAALAKAQ